MISGKKTTEDKIQRRDAKTAEKNSYKLKEKEKKRPEKGEKLGKVASGFSLRISY